MPSTPTEAKNTPWRVSLPTEKRQHTVLMFDAYGRLVASSSWHDSSPYYPTKAQSIDNFERIAAVVNERSSLLSLIEDMAKALNTHEVADKMAERYDAVCASPDWSDRGDEVDDIGCDALDLAQEAKELRRSALSRYTEFMEQNNG